MGIQTESHAMVSRVLGYGLLHQFPPENLYLEMQGIDAWSFVMPSIAVQSFPIQGKLISVVLRN